MTVAHAGLAIAKVTYTSTARSYALTSPATLAGLDEFEIAVSATGHTATEVDGSIICQRGLGEHPGEDITDLLLSSIDAKLSRGRAEVDAGEALQEVSLTCLHRPGVMPGHPQHPAAHSPHFPHTP